MIPTGEFHTSRYGIFGARNVRGILACFLLLVAPAPALASHAKTDVVTTDDGNTFIGEIKGVDRATLSLKTDAGGLLDIEWRRVTSLTSKFKYRVEISGGVRYFGSLGTAKKAGRLSIVSLSGTVEVDLAEVFAISPLADGFWESLDGALDFGATYTQSNESLQYNLSGNVARRVRTGFTMVSGQSIFNTQKGGETTNQYYLKLAMTQILRKKWGLFELGELQANPAQGYDLRVIVGGGASTFLIEDSWRLLVLNLGIVYNRENVTDGSEVDGSAEALVSISFQRFKRSSHSPNVQLNFATFANIGGTSRFRSVLNFQVNWKIAGNFKFGVQVNNGYDSNPPGTDSQNNDLSLVTSLGYTF